MRPNAGAHIDAYDFDRDISEEDVLVHLANLSRRAATRTPILDDDDYEAAIDEAAHEIAGG
ncbi:hypothetical protein [Streptomyces sp. NPDC088246]|uniref:hypothetical protein n=1 Tax=Streptomyces sp. NPDC088246 TaxID=3365842 RepID=UPI0037FE7CFD